MGISAAHALLFAPGSTVPGALDGADAPAPMELARADCEVSLSRSIIKRTDATDDQAAALASLRCGVLVGALDLSDLASADDT